MAAAKTPNHAERAHAVLSASGAARWIACPPSARLEAGYPDKATSYTIEGTKAHEVAEIYVRAYTDGKTAARGRAARIKRELKALDGVTDEMLEGARAYAEYVQGLQLAGGEDAAVMVEQRLDLTAWIPESFGTGDALVISGNALHVVDYKFGKGVKVEAEGNAQMRLYALGAIGMLADLYEIEHVTMAIFQPRLDHISEAGLSTSELVAWANDVVAPAAAKAWAGEGDYAMGEHCKWCKAFADCRKVADSVAADFEAYVPGDGAKLSDDEYESVLANLSVYSSWVKHMEADAVSAIMDGRRSLKRFKVVEGRSARKVSDADKLAANMTAAGIDEAMLYERKLLGITDLEKLAGKKRFAELSQGCVEKPKGKPTLAPITDKREPYSCAGDFEAEA